MIAEILDADEAKTMGYAANLADRNDRAIAVAPIEQAVALVNNGPVPANNRKANVEGHRCLESFPRVFVFPRRG